VLLYGKLLRYIFKKPKIVISALQPPLNTPLVKPLISLLRPDLVLSLSEETERIFAQSGCKTSFLDCGVDIKKFSPCSQKRKLVLREKYGIDKYKFIILHVGTIVMERNLLGLVNLQKLSNNQVLIVTNTTFDPDQDVYARLQNGGCIILREYIKNIEEVYQLADCYIFPTLNPSNCIELPLSILEAMACNLPVITTRFGAIPRVFTNGDGLFFVDTMDDIQLILNELKNHTIIINTREKVIDFTWEKAARNLEKIYIGLLNAK